MRAPVIKAAVLAACCGAIASCASGGQAARNAHVSHALVHPASAGPPSGAAAPARPALAKPASGVITAASPEPVPAVAPALSARPASLLGVYESGVPQSYSGINRFAAKVGRTPNVVMYFSGWGDRFRAGFAQLAWRHGAAPFVELEPYTVSMRSIAAGRQDAYLESYARAVRRFGHPVLIGFAHEMNGFWYRWGYRHTSPWVFRRAWRHVVTVFRRAGARNVRWLWVINGLAPGESPIREWWPGASYVTWVAFDGYFVRRSQTFRSVFGPTIRAVRRFTRKPELIAETGIGPTAGQAAKAPGLFAGIRALNLLGLVYYDKAQNRGVYHQDWRIDGNRAAIAAFRRSIRRYLR